MVMKAAALAGVLGVGMGAWAQAAAVPQDQAPEAPTIRVQSNLVLVPATVQTKKGEMIYGLKANQFEVLADGVAQQVRLDETDDIRPISIAVVVQCSRAYAFEYPKMKGLSTMVDELVGGAPAQVAVIDFGSEPELITNFTSNTLRRERAINSITPCDDDPKAAIFDSVKYANALFARMDPKGRHVILLVSETRDHGSRSKPQETIRELGRTDTVVDAVAYSPGRDEIVEDLKTSEGANGGLLGLIGMAVQALRKNAPKEFSRESGGEYINFASQNKFDTSLNSLANRANNYYLLSFVPRFAAGEGADGNLHTLKVRVPEYPDAKIRSRESYWTETLQTSAAEPSGK